jgi:SAM-dependent methyltransferase
MPEQLPTVEELRTVGFASASDVYERGRPGYPRALIDFLLQAIGERPAPLVLDIAAGTGKLTRQMTQAGARCVAVEPSASMLQVLRSTTPEAAALAGSAEALPIANASVDLVTVAQAFHWFDVDRSVNEMKRVLRPGGLVAIVWNQRDDTVPWIAELGRTIDPSSLSPRHNGESFGQAVEDLQAMGGFDHCSFRHEVEMSKGQIEEMVASRSYVRVLDEPRRQGVLDRVRHLVSTMPEPISVMYNTHVFTARRSLAPG